METTTMGYRSCTGFRVVFGLYRDDGQEDGNYYNGLYEL